MAMAEQKSGATANENGQQKSAKCRRKDGRMEQSCKGRPARSSMDIMFSERGHEFSFCWDYRCSRASVNFALTSRRVLSTRGPGEALRSFSRLGGIDRLILANRLARQHRAKVGFSWLYLCSPIRQRTVPDAPAELSRHPVTGSSVDFRLTNHLPHERRECALVLMTSEGGSACRFGCGGCSSSRE